MKSTQRIVLVAMPMTVFLVVHFSTVGVAQTTLISQLASWDVPPTGSVFPGGDFDPTLDTTPTCSGCWYGKSTGSGITFSYSTEHKTQGAGALKAVIVGKGSGGVYTVNYNCTGAGGGPPCSSQELDTHFDNPLLVTYSNNPAANGGVLDPRFTALNNAINSGEQALYNIEFDIIYDVASMRAIPWQMPEETVNPGMNNENRYPQRYFWTGSQGVAFDSFQWVGFDANTITPFSSQYDGNLFPVYHASFPLSAFGFNPDASPDQHTFRQLGILYNSVFGTLPAGSNTSGVTVYFDNLRLTKLDPITPIDFNNNNMADADDWRLFMQQLLVENPPVPPNPSINFDLVGNFGSATLNGVVDFHDLQKFEEYYDLANGSGAFAALSATVPEPGTAALVLLSLLGLVLARNRRWSRVCSPVAAVAALMLVGQPAAHAQIGTIQLVEGFETIGKWAVWPGADANATPITVGLSSTGATQGTKSLKVTQGSDTLGGFSWNAATTPMNWQAGDTAWNVLSSAVRYGAEHFNLMADVTFVPADTFDTGLQTLNVTLGLNFSGQGIGLYASEPDQFTNTAVIPLSAFNLPDALDHGATGYSAQIGFAGNNPEDVPYSVYIDNIRIEQISLADQLTLEINRSNGLGILKNLGTNPVSWNYLELVSAGGSLDPAGWSSLDDQNADGADVWREAGGSTATQLVEHSLLGSHTLSPGQTISLGNLYNEFVNAEDVSLRIRRAAGPTDRRWDQLVTYIGIAPAGAIGDYNDDGVVNAADYTKWRDNLGGAGSTLLNRDPANTGVVSQADYNSWKAHFGEIGGAGSLSAGAVPEPGTLVFAAGAFFATCIVGRGRIA